MSGRAAIALVAATVLGTFVGGAACGGAPAASSSGSVHLVSLVEAPAEADGKLARKGVAVIAVGVGDPPMKATRSLARVVYKSPALRPRADETTVQVLAGGPAPAGDPALAELAELRSALPVDVETAAAKALLQAIAEKIDARALVLVSVGGDGRALGRLVRLDLGGAGSGVRVDDATFASAVPSEREDFVWTGVDDALSAILRTNEVGPRRDLSKAPSAPNTPDEPQNLVEKPWFWVVVGGVAALGLTAVIVSQTVDTSSGTVHLQGKVLP